MHVSHMHVIIRLRSGYLLKNDKNNCKEKKL